MLGIRSQFDRDWHRELLIVVWIVKEKGCAEE